MSVSGQVSISSSIGTNLVFTVTGTNTLAYAKTFQNILLNAGTVTETVLNPGNTGTPGTGTESFGGTYALNLNEIVLPGAYTLPAPTAGDITFVDTSGPTNGPVSVTGSGGGDYVLFTGINPSDTYVDVGGGNTIIFAEGNDLYDGSAATGNDIIVAGTGFDTITTGTGNDTVYSGTGTASITLNDTVGFSTMNSAFNDYVYLNDGSSSVFANGGSDAIFATAPGQVIDARGNTDSTAAAIVTILPNGATTPGAVSGGDSIYAGASSIAVFDAVGNNTLFGDSGSGLAYFITGANLTDTINSAGGPVYAFGSDGDSITFSGAISTDVISGFAAGLGNETLNGAGATGGVLALYGANVADSVAAGLINESLVGGSGVNGFVTGEGNETLVAGSGSNVFYIEHTAAFSDSVSSTGTILIKDFDLNNSNDAVTFVGYTADEIATAEANATIGSASDPSYTIKLSDGTTVQFLGVNSITGHTF